MTLVIASYSCDPIPLFGFLSLGFSYWPDMDDWFSCDVLVFTVCLILIFLSSCVAARELPCRGNGEAAWDRPQDPHWLARRSHTQLWLIPESFYLAMYTIDWFGDGRCNLSGSLWCSSPAILKSINTLMWVCFLVVFTPLQSFWWIKNIYSLYVKWVAVATKNLSI
jgi:hypothetical protein